MADLCNAVVRDEPKPNDLKKSWMVNVHKGNGDALECGSYRAVLP